MVRSGRVETDNHLIHYFLVRAETDGLVCSGVDKNKKPTYALLEERVPPMKELSREERSPDWLPYISKPFPGYIV